MTILACFNDIVKLYESIKPMRGAKSKDDIRPIKERRYWWRRVKKYDDNCYALLDGDYIDYRTSTQYEFEMAPYVWTRNPETGEEFVRIRNGAGEFAHTGRYAFLYEHSPVGMYFEQDRHGQQYMHVCVSPEATRFPLPKSTHMWDWGMNREFKPDDGSYLLFKVLGGGRYERVGNEVSMRSTTIDKALKQQYKPAIEAFYTYIGAVAPMMQTDWGSMRTYQTAISEWAKERGYSTPYGRGWSFTMDETLARQVVMQEDHELRPALAACVWRFIKPNHDSNIWDASDFRLVRTRFNNKMNKLLNLYELHRG